MGLESDKNDSMGCSESANTDKVSVEEGVGQSTSIGTSRSVIIIDYVHVKVPNLNLLHACWIILVMVLGSIA